VNATIPHIDLLLCEQCDILS